MYTLGIDIGSSSSKTVILKDGQKIIAHSVIPLGTGTAGPQKALAEIFQQSGIKQEQIAYTVATGYGRFLCPEADAQVSELSCHAKGIHLLLPQVDTVIDIGGQDAKAFTISQQGKLIAFQMNDKCAAGTGRFLEVMARVLNVPIEQMGALAESSKHPASISNTCTVFAESEVISQLSANIPLADIAAGIHNSVAKRVAGMALRLGRPHCLAMSGGVALNSGVVKAMEQQMNCAILVDPLCQAAGALGAAVLAYEKIMKAKEKSL